MKKFTLSFCLFLCYILTHSQIPTYVPTNGLVGYWPFNGNANDESGNGNNGTVTGATLTSDRFSVSNKAYSFDGSSNYIDFGNLNIISTGVIDEYTVSFWLNLKSLNTTANGHQAMLFGDELSQNNGILIQMDSTHGYGAYIAGSANWLGYSGYIPTLNQWVHYCQVQNVNGIDLYVNGQLYQHLTNNKNNETSNNTRIGLFTGGSPRPLDGKMDEIGVWNRALTQQEITNLYNSQSCSAAITLNGPSSFCFGQNQNIGLSVDSSGTIYKQYIWSTGDTTPSILVSPTQTTKYKVTVTLNGMTCIDSITITVNAKPSISPTATPATICQGQNSTLAANATAGSGTISSYAWSSGLVGNVSSGLVSPNATTTYSVTVINSNGCSASASTTVTVNAKPSVSPTATPATICQGQSSTLAANAIAGSGTISSYAWSSGLVGNVSGGSVSPSGTTTYTVTVRNSNSCTASASVTVNVNPLPVVSINSFPAFVNINTALVTLSGSPVGGNFSGPGVSGTSFYPSSAGLGRKQVIYSFTNGNGCSNSANSSTIVYDTIVCHVSVTDTLIINTVLTGISPPNNINTIKIYPNPSSDHLNINTGNYSLMNGYSIKIINPLSQVVFQNLINQQLFNISLSGWAHGSYIIQILDATSTIIETKVLVLQ